MKASAVDVAKNADEDFGTKAYSPSPADAA